MRFVQYIKKQTRGCKVWNWNMGKTLHH